MIVGWLLTVAAISLGVPFWFDLLGKIVHLRASGHNRPGDRGICRRGTSVGRSPARSPTLGYSR